MKNYKRRNRVLTALLLASTLSGYAAPTNAVPQKAEDIKPIKVGKKLPLLPLQTVEGKSYDIFTSISRKPTVLIFYRGGWCPYCTKQLGQLQSIQPQLLKIGYQILAISADKPLEMRKTLIKTPLPYTLLSDAKMWASQMMGIAYRMDDKTYAQYKDWGIDLERTSGYTHHLLPVPSVFVLGMDGVIRFSYVNPNYAVRLEPKALLAAAEEALKPPAPVTDEKVKDEKVEEEKPKDEKTEQAPKE